MAITKVTSGVRTLGTGEVTTANMETDPTNASNLSSGSVPAAQLANAGTSWQAVTTGATLTAVAGRGYPINTTSNACTVTLPAGSVGDVVEIIDYAGTADTNNITIAANGSEKIQGATLDQVMQSEREGVRLVYVDATQGWVVGTTGYVGTTVFAPFSASGGTETTSGSYTIHTYTTSSTFTVSGGTSKTIEYLIIAGGGSGDVTGGGGAGGHLEGTHVASTAGGNGSGVYTVTVGAGGTGGNRGAGTSGENSSITGETAAVGGGIGASDDGTDAPAVGGSGGGGGGSGATLTGAAGTTDQGYAGGDGLAYRGAPNFDWSGGGGGGAGAVGANSAYAAVAGAGGAGKSNSYSGASVQRAGGGGGGAYDYGTSGTAGAAGAGGGGRGGAENQSPHAGTVNTGGGGGACGLTSSGNYNGTGKAGGSGLVIIRYLT